MTTDTQQPAPAAALDLVKSSPSVAVRELPDGGIAIDVEPPKLHNKWVAPAAGCVLGVVLLVAGNIMRVDEARESPGYVSSGPIKLMVLGGICVVFGPMVLMIQVMQGPPRPAALEVRPGVLRADRSVASDRQVSSYGARDVHCLFVDGRVLGAVTRTGDQWLIPFGASDVNRAIAIVIASRLWHPDDVFGGPVPKFNRWAIAPRAAFSAEEK